jgi:hypothetical protein
MVLHTAQCPLVIAPYLAKVAKVSLISSYRYIRAFRYEGEHIQPSTHTLL